MDALACGWDTARFLIFSENVFAPLIYYSHIGPFIASALIGVAVIFNNPRALINRVLFAITLFFSIWIYFDLILWASEKPAYIMFFWSMIVPVELLIYAASWYLVAIFANQGHQPSFSQKALAVATFFPILAFNHTAYNLLGFDLSNCDREAIEGPIVQYLFLIQLLFIAWVVATGVYGYARIKNSVERSQLVLVTTGVTLFLLTWVSGNIIVTYFLELDWSYEQYKLIGMPIFVAFITYSAIRFKTFDLKVFTAQALVIATSILVLSLLFIRTIENVRIVTVITFAGTGIIGMYLIRNVRREIEQRQLIEMQERELENVNQQQETLLHFISHEVKGFLAEGQNAFAGIVEGDFGEPPPKLKGIAQVALGKMRNGVSTVMDILDASNLKKGTMQYKKELFDFASAVKAVATELEANAREKGLTISQMIQNGNYSFSGDVEKIKRHVVRNLIDNAIRYTPAGTISVSLERMSDTIRFLVSDSGVGITREDMQHLFTEGGHGKDSIKTNVNSTGYGLFVAKSVVDAHGGKIWAESDGEGKGSTFVVELPAA